MDKAQICETLIRIKEIVAQCYFLIATEKDYEARYILEELNDSQEILSEMIAGMPGLLEDEETVDEIIEGLIGIHDRLFSQAPNSLDSYIIPRNDFEERQAANNPLKGEAEALKLAFSKLDVDFFSHNLFISTIKQRSKIWRPEKPA